MRLLINTDRETIELTKLRARQVKKVRHPSICFWKKKTVYGSQGSANVDQKKTKLRSCVCVVLNKKKPIIAAAERAYAGLQGRTIEWKRKQDLQAIMKRIHHPVMEQQEVLYSMCVYVREGALRAHTYTQLFLFLSPHTHAYGRRERERERREGRHSKALLDASCMPYGEVATS